MHCGRDATAECKTCGGTATLQNARIRAECKADEGVPLPISRPNPLSLCLARLTWVVGSETHPHARPCARRTVSLSFAMIYGPYGGPPLHFASRHPCRMQGWGDARDVGLPTTVARLLAQSAPVPNPKGVLLTVRPPRRGRGGTPISFSLLLCLTCCNINITHSPKVRKPYPIPIFKLTSFPPRRLLRRGVGHRSNRPQIR